MIEREKLRDKIVDLREKLASIETRANQIIGLLPLKWGLHCKVHMKIKEADNELCEIAREMKLDKIGLVKPRRINP